MRLRARPRHHSSAGTRQNFRIVTRGGNSWWRDFYHFLLTTTWPRFLGLVTLGYFGVNLAFGLLYWFDMPGVANAHGQSFADAFFFSMETISTLGYGQFYPIDTYTNVVASVEPLAGLLGFALATGLVFARVSRPTARMLFSEYAVVTRFHGKPTLMFRVANQRHNLILEAEATVLLLHNELSPEGMDIRRMQELKLVRSRTAMFQLSWMVMHVIDEDSPLHGMSEAELRNPERDYAIVALVTGMDEDFYQQVHSRKIYTAEHIRWHRRLADVVERGSEGRMTINYHRFHDLESDGDEQ